MNRDLAGSIEVVYSALIFASCLKKLTNLVEVHRLRIALRSVGEAREPLNQRPNLSVERKLVPDLEGHSEVRVAKPDPSGAPPEFGRDGLIGVGDAHRKLQQFLDCQVAELKMFPRKQDKPTEVALLEVQIGQDPKIRPHWLTAK